MEISQNFVAFSEYTNFNFWEIFDFRKKEYVKFSTLLTRLLFALMYRSYFMKGLGSKYRIHAEVSFVCYIFEVLSLLMLSFAPSREDFKLHKNSFAVFLVVSALYMLLTFWLLHFKWLKPRRPWEETGTVNQNWEFNSEIII